MSFIKKAIVVNAGAFIGVLISTAQTILMTRVLGPEGIGQYSLSVAALSLVATVFALGYPLSYLYYAKHDSGQRANYFMAAFWILLLVGALAGIGLVTLFFVWKDYFGAYDSIAIALLLPYAPLALLRVLFRNHLMVDIQAKRLAALELVALLGAIIFTLICWMLECLTVSTALISFIMAIGIRAFLGWIWVEQSINLFSGKPGRSFIGKLSRMGFRQFWPDMFTMLNDQVGILLLKYLIKDFAEIGFFSRATSVATLLIMLSQAVMPVLFSSYAGLSSKAVPRQVEKVLRFVTSFSVAMVVVMTIFGEWIIILLYGKAFLPALIPLRILAIGSAFAVISRTFTQLFSGRGMPEKGVMALSIGTLFTGLLCFVLIPCWGTTGCALAISCGQLSIFLVMFIAAKTKFDLSFKNCVFLNQSDVRNTLSIFSKRKHDA